MKLTVNQANHLASQADRLFHRAALAWERGNNSGESASMTRCANLCDKYRAQAEALLAPLGIEVDYPGLYPSFKVNGKTDYTTISAISAALEAQEVAA